MYSCLRDSEYTMTLTVDQALTENECVRMSDYCISSEQELRIFSEIYLFIVILCTQFKYDSFHSSCVVILAHLRILLQIIHSWPWSWRHSISYRPPGGGPDTYLKSQERLFKWSTNHRQSELQLQAHVCLTVHYTLCIHFPASRWPHEWANV